MRNRIRSVVATIVAGVTLACSDAAVDQVTAPPRAATPAQPVLNQYPTTLEYLIYGIPSAIGLRITTDPTFEDHYETFTVLARVIFEWANDVSAYVKTNLIDKSGRVVNNGSAGVEYKRAFFPVAYGDTTFTVSISTHGQKCGLMGRHTYGGRSAQLATNNQLITITLWRQDVLETNGMDLLQPACPAAPPPPGCEQEAASRVIGGTTVLSTTEDDCPAPAPPAGSDEDDEPVQVCYTIWREFWIFDLFRQILYLLTQVPIGFYCYYTGNMT